LLFPTGTTCLVTKEEFGALRSQIATSNGRGGRRYRPYMFKVNTVIRKNNSD